ncbi:MAG: trehalose-phosphatase, partial [Candidatus Zixiibacteriota bacterium]
MKVIPNNFFIRLSQAESGLLMLDYDGTLAPFRVERDQAFPYPGVESRLDRIIERGKTGIVIISGRAIADLKPLLNLRKYPEMWGSHGWEVLTAEGDYHLLPADENARRGLVKAENFIRDNGFAEHVEVKPVSLAIHYRGVEIHKLLAMKDIISNNWNSLTTEHNLTFS